MAWSHLRMSRILFAATHTMRMNMQLFAGHVLGSRPIKRRKKCASNDNSCYLTLTVTTHAVMDANGGFQSKEFLDCSKYRRFIFKSHWNLRRQLQE